MNIAKDELNKEKKHLVETIETIKKIIDEKNVSIESYKKEIITRKRFLYEHSTEFFKADLCAEMNDEDMNVTHINRDINKIYKLHRSAESPYFSRIDFKEENGDNNSFYIGLTGVNKDYEPIVYDWRTPIANLYYNYGIGKSNYEGGMGIIKGETTLKRQFDIKMGNLISVYDSKIGVNDLLLEEVLSNNTSDYMKNIVNTIQKEQNDIIRYPSSKTVIVEGVAGSGKTSVALHRIAYLLYNNKTLSNNNVLIFSPSDIFTNYISNVLPELGEENVSTTTFKDFAKNYIKGLDVEGLIEFIERYYEADESDDEQIKFKLTKDYKRHLDSLLNIYFENLSFSKKIGLKNISITKDELNDLKRNVPKNISFHDKIVNLSEKLCSKLNVNEVNNSKKMTSIIYNILNIPNNPLELYKETCGVEIKEKVKYEDIFGILYIYFEIRGYPSLSFIKHIVIDEAQDYSLWQFEMIKKIFSSATFTILGDTFQSINPCFKYNTLEEITDIFKDSSYKKLTKSYRSSKEIIEYANKILNLNFADAIRSNNGIKVQEIKEKDYKKDILEIICKFKEKKYKNVAIITKNRKETDLIKTLVSSEIQVLPVYISKGLEFDAVIIYTKKENAYKENENNLFYVAATRALHALTVFNQKI